MLFIVFAEISVLAHDLLRSQPESRGLDTYEIILPKQKTVSAEVDKKNIIIEQELKEKLDKQFEEIKENIYGSLAYQISESAENLFNPKDNIEKQTNEKVFIDNDLPEILVAIVIDDIGLNRSLTKRIANIKKPITTALLPYGASDKTQAEMLQKSGKELILHTPMLPHVVADLAPVTLSPEMGRIEIQEELIKMFNRFDGVDIVGINNHMGSLFTEKKQAMGYVMEVLRHRKIYFLDSKTTPKSVGKEMAHEYNVPYISRDVFLDNVNDYDYIMKQLKEVEKIAYKKGYAVAIGHPHSQTLNALEDWLKEVENRGIKLVLLSDIVKKINKN